VADTFQLEIVTPERRLVSDAAQEMQIPGKSGYLGILPGHAPLLTELAVGEISYRNASGVQRLAVAWGFAEVLPEKVTILAENAERAADIDVERARRARDRALELIKAGGAELDYQRAEESLQRAQARLDIAEKK
jgi:F-type H+-transporting ATPase subunit epsilon